MYKSLFDVDGVVLQSNFHLKRVWILPHALSASLRKMYSKLIFNLSYIIIIISIFFILMCDPQLTYPVKCYSGVGSCPTYINEGKTSFTFLPIYTKEWLFYDDIFMAWIWIVVLFIAKKVPVFSAFLPRKGCFEQNFSVDILGLGKVESYNLAQCVEYMELWMSTSVLCLWVSEMWCTCKVVIYFSFINARHS